MSQESVAIGTLHVYVAFDWGEQIRLDQAERQVPASRQELPRRRRTPPSFTYRPLPLHLALEPVTLEMPELGTVKAPAGLTLFDFGAVSLALACPSRCRCPRWCAWPARWPSQARWCKRRVQLLEPLFRQVLPAIDEPCWQTDLSEEYFVFQLSPSDRHLEKDATAIAGLVHLESATLSASEVAEALRLQLSYSPDDVFIADWSAAVLIDRDCEETLQAVEFANLQLLELRHIDNRLDNSLAEASRAIEPWTRSRLPFCACMAGNCACSGN